MTTRTETQRGDASPLTPAEDWPPVPAPTEENRRETVRSLRALNEEVRLRTDLAQARARLRPGAAPAPQRAVQPPSMSSVVPVTRAAAGEAR